MGHILKFRDSHRESVPSGAAESLDAALSRRTSFSSLKAGNAPEFLQVMVTVLASFRAEFEYHLSDASAVAMRLSERAFEHLQRSIVADDEFRRKWAEAFEKNEPACERLGAIHLSLHGIWAFKIDAKGEKTDLVFNEPIRESSLIERAAEALVLTEWKRVHSPKETEAMAAAARQQAARYRVGALAGVELKNYGFIVLVSKEHLTPPEDHLEDGVTYRHINIAVNPKSPSKS